MTHTRHTLPHSPASAALLAILMAVVLAACTPTPHDAVESGETPPIYPDYADVAIPPNIAPLNFMLRADDCEALQVEVTASDDDTGGLTLNSRGNEALFDLDEWHSLLSSHKGDTLRVSVTALIGGQWTAYRSFTWYVAPEPIDAWLTYRLIEPDYEIWNRIVLQQRCVESFDEAPLADHQRQDNRCMNCHTPARQRPDLSMLYVRGEGGGAILNRGGHLRKLNLKGKSMVSGSVYFGFSPTGRYVCFSTNVIIPAFHSLHNKRLEVYDSRSDVYVADLDRQCFLSSPLTSSGKVLETFPTFSPDGHYIYYCAADSVPLPEDLHRLQYSLVRIGFDEQTGQIGNRTDTIVRAADGGSVCHPRLSPDGQRLLYTVQRYGTFPIWHQEADQRMLNLATGQVDSLTLVNSPMSDTYHSWSSNSRWFVFASKRDDGLYGKPYFCYVDPQGHAHKPFCLPQRSAKRYDECLKSFNAPELCTGRLPFDPDDVARAMKQEALQFEEDK